MAPIVALLMERGLTLLGNAVLSKGQQVVEDKLGIKLTEKEITENAVRLRQLEMEHEEFLVQADIEKEKLSIAAEAIAQNSVTARWQADMLSDSWLSKNIRPAVLIILLTVYTIFSLLSAADVNVNPAYVELLAQMLMLVMGAYFAGRTLEKVVDMKERGK